MTEPAKSGPIQARTTSRKAILDRVRQASAGFDPAPIQRRYRQAGDRPDPAPETMREVFIDRLVDYKAQVTRCLVDDVGAAVTAFLAAESAVQVIVPDGFPDNWLPSFDRVDPPMVRRDDHGPLTVAELDRCDAVVTTCAVAIAETGTIVLDGGTGQGRRALTLLPDLHVVVVTIDQLVARVPDALGRLDPRRPLTWISGPSATSDIELNRVEGVHGPRQLRVVVAER